SVTGQPDSPPTKAGTSVGDITGGLFALAGITSALYHRAQTGQGMKVDVSMLDGQIAILESAVMRYMTTGQTPGPIGNRHPSIAPFEPIQTADKPIIVAAGNDSLFRKLALALGKPEWPADPRFVSNSIRLQNIDILKHELEAVMKQRPRDHWLEVLDRAGVPSAPIHDVAEAVSHPQVKARNMIVAAGNLRMAGNPIKMSPFSDLPTRRPAPSLDADGASLRSEFGN